MRIVTYNTRGSLGLDMVRSTRRIADVVRSLSPDVVCFQEIHKRLLTSGREDQPEALSVLLARPFLFQRNVRFGFGGYGVGIAMRGTLLERKEHFLPSKKEQRGALEIRLRDVGGLKAVTVFCTHWGLQSEERKQQAEALAALVCAAPRPIVVCGDLNEAAGDAGVRLLLASTGLIDAGAQSNQPTFVSDNPTVRIDYCLYSPELQATRVEVASHFASDHLPLMVDLEPA